MPFLHQLAYVLANSACRTVFLAISICLIPPTHMRFPQVDGVKTEYRVWNPFRSKLAAAILGGVGEIHIKPGTKLLYLGAASGTTVSHCSDVVGPTGELIVSQLNSICMRS